jgi:alpha-L-fucosidase
MENNMRRITPLSIAAMILMGVVIGTSASNGEKPSADFSGPESPNCHQRAQIARRYGMFIHFGINTFHDQEWTDGTLPAKSYAPTTIDADQWIAAAKDAGMKFVILVCKHHDGFCLWDSKYTDYDVANSANKTDVVAAVSRACGKRGMKFGVYYSLWDRNRNPATKDPKRDKAYNRYMLQQLEELLTQYGPVCELWLDGGWTKANDRWDIPAIYALAKRCQPACQVGVNWSIGLPDNPDAPTITPDKQKEGYPIRYFPADFRLGDPYQPAFPDPKLFTHNGKRYYMPFETTVCLNDRWFYNTTDRGLKTVDQLERLYRTATAQNNILVLNVPPGRNGRQRDADVSRIKDLAAKLGLNATTDNQK